MAPHYFSNLINVRQPVIYSLRSCASTVLLFSKGKMLSTFGDRSFSMAAPKLWNALPAELRSISSLTLSLPRVPKIKIQDESQITFCKILKYK